METKANKKVLPVSYPHGKPQETAESHHHCPDQSYAQDHRVEANVQKDLVPQHKSLMQCSHSCIPKEFQVLKECVVIYDFLWKESV